MTLRFRPEAEDDPFQIGTYIERENPRAAVSFVAAIREKCENLSNNPETGRLRPELLTVLRSFPVGQYMIFYYSMDGDVEIVRIIHGARDIDALF